MNQTRTAPEMATEIPNNILRVLRRLASWTSARPGRRVLAVCGLGVAFGVATSLSNRLASPSEPDSITRIPSLILDAGWTWAALGVLAGWLASAPRSGARAGFLSGAAAGVLVLVAATAAYFGVDSIVRDEPLSWYVPEVLRWWVASVLAGPILGLVGALARRPTVPGLLARLVIPVGATLQMLGLSPAAGSPVESPAVDAARLFVLTTAAVAAAVVVARFVLAERRRRGLAAAD